MNTTIADVKKAIRETRYPISANQLTGYLAEFCYRFNRRFRLDKMIPRLAADDIRTS